MLSCLHSITNYKFKNSLTNNCCFGTGTASPWAKATFLYMYLFQYANHLNIMEEEHTKEPSHNNPEEATNYVKAVNTLLKTFIQKCQVCQNSLDLLSTNIMYCLKTILLFYANYSSNTDAVKTLPQHDT